MKKIFATVLMAFGVLFILQAIFLGWFYIADPLDMFAHEEINITKTVESTSGESNTNAETNSTTEIAPSSLSPAQKSAADNLGIEVPTFTEVQLDCLVGLFGQTRVDEIKGGDVPTALELYKGKSCL
jgi:hypothetical protein